MSKKLAKKMMEQLDELQEPYIGKFPIDIYRGCFLVYSPTEKEGYELDIDECKLLRKILKKYIKLKESEGA